MFKKMKIGDIVQSPDGRLVVHKFHKNGLAFLKQEFPPYKFINFASSVVRTYPIVERPSLERNKKAHKTFNGSTMTTAYVAWRSVRKRAEIVCPDWSDFQVFAEWFHQTRNAYPNWQSVTHDWIVAFNLLDPSNRTASPDTCCVVPFPVAAALSNTLGRSRSNDLPRGVTKMANRYVVQCSRFDTGTVRVGSYETQDEAEDAYWEAKCAAIRYTGIMFWSFMPEQLGLIMVGFDNITALTYFPESS